jgi:hypothetical protein
MAEILKPLVTGLPADRNPVRRKPSGLSEGAG